MFIACMAESPPYRNACGRRAGRPKHLYDVMARLAGPPTQCCIQALFVVESVNYLAKL